MSESIKENRSSFSLESYTTRQIITWTAAISTMVLVFIIIGVIFQRFFHREFIGERTKLIHLCKKDPSVRPTECAELLAVRTGSPPKKIRTLPGSLKKPAFRLSTDENADLQPPPDLVR
jgi:hypothetical protein